MIKPYPTEAKLFYSYGSSYRLVMGLGPALAYNTWVPWETTGTGYIYLPFIAEAGQNYTVTWDDAYDGSANYTGDIEVGAFLSNKTSRVSGWSADADSGYPGGYTGDGVTFSVTSRQLIYLRVRPYYGEAASIGSFAIRVYNASAVNTGQSFSWYLDGALISGANDYLYTLDPATLSSGSHRVTALASRDGFTFAEALTIIK